MRYGLPWARWLFVLVVVGTAATLAWLIGGGVPPWWLLALLAAALLAAIGGGVFLLGSGLFARAVLAVEPARAGARLALTFDDGPDEAHTRAVLELLEARGHRGTFFVIGNKAERAPALLAELVQRGHGLANHSYAHSYATTVLPVDRLATDLAHAQALLEQAGVRSRWFRPPVGLLSPRVAAAARRNGLTIVGWSGNARDGRASTTPEQALARLRERVRPGAILVLHDAAERGGRTPIAAAALALVLDVLEERGLRSVTLDELLGAGG